MNSNNSVVKENIFENNKVAIWIADNSNNDYNHFFKENIFNCNTFQLQNYGLNSIQPPTIDSLFSDLSFVKGKSSPTSLIELYLSDDSNCELINGQASFFIGSTITDAQGEWQITGLNLNIGDRLIATATDQEVNTSYFSIPTRVNLCNNFYDNPIYQNREWLNINIYDTLKVIGNNSNLEVEFIKHDWFLHAPDSHLKIENIRDGNANISVNWENGFNGNTLPYLNYEGIDVNGCIYQWEKFFNLSIACNANLVNDSTIIVTNANDSGSGSLREAMICANLNPEIDNIHFNINGTFPHIIEVESALPIITDYGIKIDATTQPNFELGHIIIKGDRLFNGHGIQEDSGPDQEDLEVYGLHIDDFSETGISVYSQNNKIGRLNGGNKITNCRTAINIKSGIVEGNSIGAEIGNAYGLRIFPFYTDYSPNLIVKNNDISGNDRGILVTAQNTGIQNITQNRFSCNNIPLELKNNLPPTIDSISKFIYGTASQNDSIEIFLANTSCQSTCQGDFLIAKAKADNNGNWLVPTPENVSLEDLITATATNILGNTSNFSNCFIVLPDNCRFAQPLPVNEQACSSIGAVLDLKQLTNSIPNPTSSCATTYMGNDAWYKITVPSTGNFLIRTNINNTIVPVIEIYTDCGNTALPECMVLDSTPYVMVFENYTPNDTLYLRVWDENNTVVNSAGSALLHLTAHELAANKNDWEICDYENLISDNPTNLIRREANTFILSYDSNTPQSTIDQDSIVFTDMMQMELKKSCNCGGTPLQLWSTESPVNLDGRKRYAKSRGSVDTTNYNYIFETVEFQVNSYAIGQQHATDIAMDSDGNFAMVWKDEQRRHNYGRVYLSSGNPISVEFPIGASDKTQYATRIAMLDNGEFITVWHEIDPTQTGSTFAIYGRLFNADGTPKGIAFDISTNSANTSSNSDIKESAKYGTNAQIGAMNNGDFIVTWHVGGSIFAQRYNNGGNLIGNIVEVGNTVNTGVNPSPSIAINNTGQFIITWTGIDEDENGIYIQRFDANGTAQADAFLVNTIQNKNQNNPDIALAEDGSFIITWESFEQVGADTDYDIYAQRFDANANKIGNEFLVNSYTTDAQTRASISLFDNGNFLIAWSSLGQDGYAEGIYAKLFDANGNPIAPSFDDSDKGSVGEEFRMNTYNEPQQDKPRTATNGNNIFMGAWEDGANDGSYEGIFAQRYETIEVDNTRIFYPIGTATPSTLMGDEMPYPTTTYHPGSSVKKAKVAILDTGIDHSHALIQNAIWQNPEINDSDNCLIGDEIGYDFVNRTGIPIDLDGHGTQVSGILTRNFDSEVKLELMDLKFHELEKGNVFDAICGIYYAVDNGANVINLSWGFEASEEPVILKKALQYASDKDVLIVTTAGNTSKNNDNINKYPANLDIPNIIVVTAYQYKNSTGEIKLANYASHGKNKVDIAAYGYVETAKRGGQKALAAGTSLAAPAVARTAATIKGLYPVLTAAEIKDCILSTVEAVASLTNKVATGGILDHDAALACAQTKAEMITNNACSISGLIINANSAGACNTTEGAIDLSFSGNDINPKFLWSTGDTTQNLSNLSAGVYSITVTDNARCEQTLDVTITNDCTSNCQTNLVMNESNLNSNIYRSDNTITSSGTIETGYNVVFKAAESITLSNGFHAKAGSEFLATIEDCTSGLTEEIAEERSNTRNLVFQNLGVRLYPNPTQDLLNVEVAKASQGFELELYDLIGRRLNNWYFASNQTTISMSHLSAGIYFLRVDSEIIKKFVVGKK